MSDIKDYKNILQTLSGCKFSQNTLFAFVRKLLIPEVVILDHSNIETWFYQDLRGNVKINP